MATPFTRFVALVYQILVMHSLSPFSTKSTLLALKPTTLLHFKIVSDQHKFKFYPRRHTPYNFENQINRTSIRTFGLANKKIKQAQANVQSTFSTETMPLSTRHWFDNMLLFACSVMKVKAWSWQKPYNVRGRKFRKLYAARNEFIHLCHAFVIVIISSLSWCTILRFLFSNFEKYRQHTSTPERLLYWLRSESIFLTNSSEQWFFWNIHHI